MQRKACKRNRKRWMRKRIKAQRRQQFKDDWRQHFVNKGIL